MQVGKVQDAEWLGTSVENGDGDPAKPILVGLPHGVGDARSLGGYGGGEKYAGSGHRNQCDTSPACAMMEA